MCRKWCFKLVEVDFSYLNYGGAEFAESNVPRQEATGHKDGTGCKLIIIVKKRLCGNDLC